MSGEFGDAPCGPFFHDKISAAAEDAVNGDEPLTQAWGRFLECLSPVARAISWSEACDSSASDSLRVTLETLPALRSALHEVETLVRPLREEAVSAMLASNRDRIGEPRVDERGLIVLDAPRPRNMKRHEHEMWLEALTEYVREWARKRQMRGYWVLASWGGAAGATSESYCFRPAEIGTIEAELRDALKDLACVANEALGAEDPCVRQALVTLAKVGV